MIARIWAGEVQPSPRARRKFSTSGLSAIYRPIYRPNLSNQTCRIKPLSAIYRPCRLISANARPASRLCPRDWPFFANSPSLTKFWALAPTERRRVWGMPIDPLAAIADFDPDFINDGELGAR